MLTRCKILLIWVLIYLSSCALLPRFPQITSIDTLRVERNTELRLQTRVDAHVYNPNFFNFRVDELQYRAYVGPRYLGRGSIQGPLLLKAHDTVALHDEPVIICYRNFHRILNQQKQLDSVPVTFLIKAKLNLSPLLPAFYVKKLWLRPVDFLRASINTYNIEKLITINSVRLNYVDYFTSRLSVVLTLKNDFPLSYNIDSVELTIFDRYDHAMGKVHIGRHWVNEMTHVNLPFSVTIDNMNMAISLLGQSIEEDICFYARGQMYLTIKGEHFCLPINERLGLKIEWLD